MLPDGATWRVTTKRHDKINQKVVGSAASIALSSTTSVLFPTASGTDPSYETRATSLPLRRRRKERSAMINDNNVDIIWGVAGLSGNGGAEAALESGKAWFIGVDSDQELTLSAELAAITLTSGLKNIGQSLIWVFDEWDAGRTYWGTEVNLGLVEGGVGFVSDKNFKNIAPQDVQDLVLEAEQDVRDKKVEVPSAIGDDTNGVIVMRDEMQP